MVAPPGATVVVCTSVSGGLVKEAWLYTLSKTSPMTWKLDVRLGPPTPKKMRTVSPTLASSLYCSLRAFRSEEHTSELQSLMRISYAVFCLKKKKKQKLKHTHNSFILTMTVN